MVLCCSRCKSISLTPFEKLKTFLVKTCAYLKCHFNDARYYACPTAIIEEIGWRPLAEWRAKAKAVVTYKIKKMPDCNTTKLLHLLKCLCKYALCR